MLQRATIHVLDPEGGILEGRPQGRRLREEVIQVLEVLPPDSVLPLGFGRVRFLDYSCADELIAKLVRRVSAGDLGNRYVVLVQASDSVRENVSAALTLRQLTCVYEPANGEPELLGRVSPELRETYLIALHNGQITARDIVERTSKSIAASSNRLARLRALGLVAWVGSEAGDVGGRQNIFVPVR
jgi:hypothetical protein